MRRVAVALAAGALVLAVGCGGDTPEARLNVEVDSGLKRTLHTLRCGPPGGTVADAARACALVSRHRTMMLFPPRTVSSCRGGPGIPATVAVEGVAGGMKIKSQVRGCDWPGGVGAELWAALLRHPSTVARAERAARCVESRPTLWRERPSQEHAVWPCIHRAWQGG